MNETDARPPETGPGTPEQEAADASPTPPPGAANEVLHDEIESIRAIGEDQ